MSITEYHIAVHVIFAAHAGCPHSGTQILTAGVILPTNRNHLLRQQEEESPVWKKKAVHVREFR
jgi:hypothetical protein